MGAGGSIGSFGSCGGGGRGAGLGLGEQTRTREPRRSAHIRGGGDPPVAAAASALRTLTARLSLPSPRPAGRPDVGPGPDPKSRQPPAWDPGVEEGPETHHPTQSGTPHARGKLFVVCVRVAGGEGKLCLTVGQGNTSRSPTSIFFIALPQSSPSFPMGVPWGSEGDPGPFSV